MLLCSSIYSLEMAKAADPKDADKVGNIPGMADFSSADTVDVYSGYLDIPDTTKSLHYVFVESA